MLLAARVLADASDPEDLARANEIQDGFSLSAVASEPLELPDYDEESFTAIRKALLQEAAKGMNPRHVRDEGGGRPAPAPGRHREWMGGLPEREAFYASVEPHLPVGRYVITAKDVPVDAFWSITVYGADGFLHKNDLDAYSVNSVSGAKNPDGSITVNLGGDRGVPTRYR